MKPRKDLDPRGDRFSELAQWAAEQLGLTNLSERTINTGFGCCYTGLIGETGGMFIEVEHASDGPVGQVVLWCDTCRQYYHPTGWPLLGTMLDIATARRRQRDGIEPCFGCALNEAESAGGGQVVDMTTRTRRTR